MDTLSRTIFLKDIIFPQRAQKNQIQDHAQTI